MLRERQAKASRPSEVANLRVAIPSLACLVRARELGPPVDSRAHEQRREHQRDDTRDQTESLHLLDHDRSRG
ncbi:MAG TPA: hypothetical protein VM869_32995 [Enhygromyxa sp.]|nr:hypothetical protein [Enhygromyxa sp.]